MDSLTGLPNLREMIWSLSPSLRIALARDILWDIIKNKDSVGGFTDEQILTAWKSLEATSDNRAIWFQG